MADLTVYPAKSPPSSATAYPDQQDYAAASTAAGAVLAYVPSYTLVTFTVGVILNPATINPA